MSRSAGFTLLELLTAIVLTSVVTLLVYGAVQSGAEAQSRLTEQRRSLQAGRAIRAVLQDVLRGARRGARSLDTAFVLERGQDSRGRPMDRIRLVTTVAGPPFADGADWRVQIRPTGGGLALFAAPVGSPVAIRLVALAPTISGLQVRVIAQVTDSVTGEVRDSPWRREWVGGPGLPRAVELAFWSEGGPAPTLVRTVLPLGGER